MPSTMTTAAGGDGVVELGDTGVGFEVVDGALDGSAGGEAADVLDDEFGFERVGVVEVALCGGSRAGTGRDRGSRGSRGKRVASSWMACSAARVVLPEPEQPAMPMTTGLAAKAVMKGLLVASCSLMDLVGE